MRSKFPTRKELRRLAESFGASPTEARDPDSKVVMQMTLAEMEKFAEYFIVQGQKLEAHVQEPYGVLVCHKRIPNAIQEFIPIKFYREHDWGDEYSKVPVYTNALST